LKIADIRTLTLADIPIEIPFQKSPTRSTLHFVFVETDDGIVGMSEIGHGTKSAIIALIENDLAPFLKGRNPLETERLMHLMLRNFNFRAHTGAWNAAASAIDVALWDIKGKYFDTPVWRLLGGAQRTVPAYLTCGLRTYSTEQLVESANYWVSQGQTRQKILVARMNILGAVDINGSSGEHREQDPSVDAARVKAVREAVGDEVELMVDASCLLPFEAALRWFKKLEPYNLMWFEEPIIHNDVHLLAELRRRTSIPIAAGQWESLSKLTDMVRNGAVDILNPTVGFVGGFTMGMKAAAVAQAFNLPIGNGTHYDMHLHAAVPNGWRAEFHLKEWLTAKAVYEDFPGPEAGWVTLTEKAGLGLELRDDACREFRVS
jgi:L-alanine-DL-glutamate epimerase-like enolase superfamily enzyme